MHVLTLIFLKLNKLTPSKSAIIGDEK